MTTTDVFATNFGAVDPLQTTDPWASILQQNTPPFQRNGQLRGRGEPTAAWQITSSKYALPATGAGSSSTTFTQRTSNLFRPDYRTNTSYEALAKSCRLDRRQGPLSGARSDEDPDSTLDGYR